MRASRAHATEPSRAASQPPVATCLAGLWQELLLFGELPPERWDGDGFIKKLTCRETIGATCTPTMPPLAPTTPMTPWARTARLPPLASVPWSVQARRCG